MARRSFVVGLVTVMGVALGPSCSGDTETAGGAGGGSAVAYALDNVCDLVVPELCAMREGCCTASGLGYDESGCESYERAECDANVAEVEAGTMSFDPTHIDECLAEFGPYVDRCAVTVPDRVGMLDVFLLCASIFQGERELGASCERDAQCAQTATMGEYVSCAEATSTCTRFTVLGVGDACELGGTSRSFCDSGLYCDATLGAGGPPYQGDCQVATAPGDPCDTQAVPFSLECGLGYYCDEASGSCLDAKDAGEACTTALECQSISCPVGTGECDPVEVVVDAVQCHGAG